MYKRQVCGLIVGGEESGRQRYAAELRERVRTLGLSEALLSVSYTHLFRSAHILGMPMPYSKDEINEANRLAVSANNPVSYTHLDVYKRQE